MKKWANSSSDPSCISFRRFIKKLARIRQQLFKILTNDAVIVCYSFYCPSFPQVSNIFVTHCLIIYSVTITVAWWLQANNHPYWVSANETLKILPKFCPPTVCLPLRYCPKGCLSVTFQSPWVMTSWEWIFLASRCQTYENQHMIPRWSLMLLIKKIMIKMWNMKIKGTWRWQTTLRLSWMQVEGISGVGTYAWF